MKLILALCLSIVLAAPAGAQTPTETTQKTQEIDVTGSQQWTDSGIDVARGQTATITATGKLEYLDGKSAAPEGLARTWRDLLHALPVNSAGRGALIGRIGADADAQTFLIGDKVEMTVRIAGRLFLGINGPADDTANGTFHVTILLSGAAAASSAIPATSPQATTDDPADVKNLTGSSLVPPESPVPAAGSTSPGTPASPSTATSGATISTISADLLTQIPRRIADKDGNPGDMVNFLIIGPEESVKSVFEAAGWVQVDRNTTGAIFQALVATLSKQVYLTMPMSQLYLFGRPQDYGFAHAEPLTVVTTRHHLRIWKSTLTVDGQPLWVGAATHDMGLERDQRNGKLTHHIDPNVDDERDFVNRSLTGTGYVAQHSMVTPSDPVKDAKTATGGGFHSNGQILVLRLTQ